MKIVLLITSLLAVVFLSMRQADSGPPAEVSVNKYQNSRYGYEILVPAGFQINSEIEALVVLENPSARLRVNAGCFASGVENLTPVIEPVQLNGHAALKEDYYDDSRLKIRRITLNGPGNQCLALEGYSQTEEGWQEVGRVMRGFKWMP